MSRLHQPSAAGAPPIAIHFDVNELMAVTLRLAEILGEESNMLASMDIANMAKMHPEKLKLTQMLEAYQSMMRARPDLMDDLNENERGNLAEVMSGFSQVMDHNFRQVAAARAVNQTVVRAITDSIAEQQHLTVYNREGNHFRAGVEMSGVSINLNQKA
jgi:hypothetical protein